MDEEAELMEALANVASEPHGPPAGTGAEARTRRKQNPYPERRVRVSTRDGGSPVTRESRLRPASEFRGRSKMVIHILNLKWYYVIWNECQRV